MKIGTRIVLGFLLITAVGFYYLAQWVINDVRPHYMKSMEESLIDTATLLASQLSTRAAAGEIPVDDLRAAFDHAYRREFSARVYDLEKKRVNIRVYVTDRRGIVLFDSDGGKDEGKDYSRWNDVRFTLAGKYGARTSRTDPADLTRSSLFVASPVTRGGDTIGVLTVVKPTDSVSLFIELARRKIVTAAWIAGFSALLLGVGLSVWVTLPIKRLTAYARAIRDNRKTALPRLGRSEVAVLGKAFEEMREALEGKNYVENYVQTLTHEIKSPLSAIRGAAELMDEEMPPDRRARFLANIRAEADRIQNIVERLLDLSALENRKGLKDVEEIDLATLAAEIVQSQAATLERKRVAVTTVAPEPVPVRGERFLLRQAIANLLSNAVDFVSEGGAVTVGVVRQGKSCVLTVEDDGAGIPAYAVDKIFEQFYSLSRPDTNRKSTGLGLSLVKEVAALHGGGIAVENRAEGGVRATLTLPSSLT